MSEPVNRSPSFVLECALHTIVAPEENTTRGWRRIEPEGGQHRRQIRLRDYAIAVLIEKRERFLELTDLRYGELVQCPGGGPAAGA